MPAFSGLAFCDGLFIGNADPFLFNRYLQKRNDICLKILFIEVCLQNVDHAFRLSQLQLKDGTARAGLFRREEGAALVFSDIAGNEFTIPKSSISSRENTPLSLMPPIYGDALPEEQLFDLIKILSQ